MLGLTAVNLLLERLLTVSPPCRPCQLPA